MTDTNNFHLGDLDFVEEAQRAFLVAPQFQHRCANFDEDCLAMSKSEILLCACYDPEQGYCPLMD